MSGSGAAGAPVPGQVGRLEPPDQRVAKKRLVATVPACVYRKPYPGLLNEDSAKLARPVRVPLNGTVGQPGRIEAVENFAADAKAKDTRHSDGRGSYQKPRLFFPSDGSCRSAR